MGPLPALYQSACLEDIEEALEGVNHVDGLQEGPGLGESDYFSGGWEDDGEEPEKENYPVSWWEF